MVTCYPWFCVHLSGLNGFVLQIITLLYEKQDVSSGQNPSIKRCELKEAELPRARMSLRQTSTAAGRLHRAARLRTVCGDVHLHNRILERLQHSLCFWPQQNTCLTLRHNATLDRVQRNSVTITRCGKGRQCLPPFVHGCFTGTEAGQASLFQDFSWCIDLFCRIKTKSERVKKMCQVQFRHTEAHSQSQTT